MQDFSKGFDGVPGNVDAANCRAPVDCNSTIPKPTVESHLLESTSTGLKEYDEAVFKCKDGYTLLDSDGKAGADFKLKCGTGGQYPDSPTWSTCLLEKCMHSGNLPTGFKLPTTNTDESTPVGAKTDLVCDTGALTL